MVFQGTTWPESVEDAVERGLCLVPEKRELFSDMTVADNLLLGAYAARPRGAP